MKFQLLAEHSVHFLAYYNSSCFVYWFIVCVHWLASIFVNVISINHALRRQLFIHSFIHSLGTFVWGWAARSIFSHITRNNFLQTHSWKWFDNEKEINCMLSLSTRLPSLSRCLPLIRSHALGGSSCCCHLGLHSSAKHPFPPFAVPLSLSLLLSLSVIWCDMLHCVCVCVCVSFMHISNRAAYCSPPSRTDIPLHWGPHRALPLYSNCCPASSLAALLPLLYLPRVQSQPEPSADAAEPRQRGQLKHICIMPVCLWSGRKLIRCIGLDLCPTTWPELVQE